MKDKSSGRSLRPTKRTRVKKVEIKGDLNFSLTFLPQHLLKVGKTLGFVGIMNYDQAKRS
jgi:hypothetical protein